MGLLGECLFTGWHIDESIGIWWASARRVVSINAVSYAPSSRNTRHGAAAGVAMMWADYKVVLLTVVARIFM
jgi:hypothetical protein